MAGLCVAVAPKLNSGNEGLLEANFSELLYDIDYSLLQLKSPPPEGVNMAGWTTEIMANETSVTTVHHPSGDLKKISKGLNLGLSSYEENDGYYVISWSSGVIEGGSSGSGLWNANRQLTGVASAGSSSCDNKSGLGAYTRFDLIYPKVSKFLTAKSDDNTLNQRFSGAWYNRDRSGEGWLIEMLLGNRINAYWFTYDNAGNPLYIFGSASYDPNSASVTVPAYITDGPVFGDAYNRADLVRKDWGTMTFSFKDCRTGAFSYDSILPEYGSGEREVTRLSIIEGSGCN